MDCIKYCSLSKSTSQEDQLQCALDEFPWTTATQRNCTSLLCSAKSLAKRDEKQPRLLYLHLSNTPFFSLPDFALPPLLFWSPKHAFRLHPNLLPADYFSLEEKDLPFISGIITLQWREGELCIWPLPAVRCMWGITFHSGKVIPEVGLHSELQSFQFSWRCFVQVACVISNTLKANAASWWQHHQILSLFLYKQESLFLLAIVISNAEMRKRLRIGLESSSSAVSSSSVENLLWFVCFAPCKKSLDVCVLLVQSVLKIICLNLVNQREELIEGEKKVTKLHLIHHLCPFAVQDHLWKKEKWAGLIQLCKCQNHQYFSVMLFKCDICTDKSWMLHLPTAMATGWYKSPAFCRHPL